MDASDVRGSVWNITDYFREVPVNSTVFAVDGCVDFLWVKNVTRCMSRIMRVRRVLRFWAAVLRTTAARVPRAMHANRQVQISENAIIKVDELQKPIVGGSWTTKTDFGRLEIKIVPCWTGKGPFLFVFVRVSRRTILYDSAYFRAIAVGDDISRTRGPVVASLATRSFSTTGSSAISCSTDPRPRAACCTRGMQPNRS